MSTVMLFTHKGWFGFCPVYIAEEHEAIIARYNLDWFLKLNKEIAQLILDTIGLITHSDDFEIDTITTGILSTPLCIEFLDS